MIWPLELVVYLVRLALQLEPAKSPPTTSYLNSIVSEFHS